jgi:hypothetical protein
MLVWSAPTPVRFKRAPTKPAQLEPHAQGNRKDARADMGAHFV